MKCITCNLKEPEHEKDKGRKYFLQEATCNTAL